MVQEAVAQRAKPAESDFYPGTLPLANVINPVLQKILRSSSPILHSTSQIQKRPWVANPLYIFPNIPSCILVTH